MNYYRITHWGRQESTVVRAYTAADALLQWQHYMGACCGKVWGHNLSPPDRIEPIEPFDFEKDVRKYPQWPESVI